MNSTPTEYGHATSTLHVLTCTHMYSHVPAQLSQSRLSHEHHELVSTGLVKINETASVVVIKFTMGVSTFQHPPPHPKKNTSTVALKSPESSLNGSIYVRT